MLSCYLSRLIYWLQLHLSALLYKNHSAPPTAPGSLKSLNAQIKQLRALLYALHTVLNLNPFTNPRHARTH